MFTRLVGALLMRSYRWYRGAANRAVSIEVNFCFFFGHKKKEIKKNPEIIQKLTSFVGQMSENETNIH